jgi:hypothetical protein
MQHKQVSLKDLRDKLKRKANSTAFDALHKSLKCIVNEEKARVSKNKAKQSKGISLLNKLK